jgi:endonuclease/exonuclease/phosphatase family metal-dependent hydrolase
MKIISWNILAIEFVKKSYYPYIDINLINNRKRRIKQIVSLLQEENPDIILLQEVMPFELDFLKSKLEHHYIVSDLCKIDWAYYKNSESGNVTIFKKDIFSFESSNNLIYNNLVFGLQTVLQIKKTNKLLHIFNIHLNDEHSQTRNAQINSLRPLLLNAKYCILGGDFNQEYNKNSKLFKITNFITQNHHITYYIEDNMNIDNILTKGFDNDDIYKDKIDLSVSQRNISQQKIFEKIGSDHLPVITMQKLR